MAQHDPTLGEAVRQLVTQNRFQDLYADMFGRYDLTDNDLVDVLTANLLLCWLLVSDAELPPADAVHGLRTQMQQLLLRQPTLVVLTSSQRQAQADRVLYETVYLNIVSLELEKQPDQQARRQLTADVRHEYLSSFGLDLAGAELARDGLRLRH